MPTRIAGCLSLVAFAACLAAGVLVADNSIETTVMRALYAMGGTFVIGWVAGAMVQRVLRENLEKEAEALRELREQQLRQAEEAAKIPTVGG